MAVAKNAFFVFEVVVEKLITFIESRVLVIKCDFADIFSLEVKDPKSMHIKIPDPPPPPPEPPSKGKKKKPKPKKPKKGKKGKEPPPPPEPEILVGQSILFTCSPEVIVQNMKKWPLELSLWSKEDNLVFIGKSRIEWDPAFIQYLEKIYRCEDTPPVVVKDEYNIFSEEGTGRLSAKITLQVKLSYLTDKVFTCFRTLTEDNVIKKVLYTGMNSKTTSYMTTLKTTDEEYQENLSKIVNNYIRDRELAQPLQPSGKPVVFADFKNAPGAELPLDADGEYCCRGNADKPPDDKYGALERYPDIDFICEYIRKIISSCNDNMRMLTPHPNIRPKIRASDIEKLCYCKQTGWPQSDLAERFRKETQGGPCPVCIRQLDGKTRPGLEGTENRVLDIANIRGPCGRPDCRIARDIRAYLEKIVEEDNKEVILEDIIGPCGSKECSLVDKIKDFLQHRGRFTHGATAPGLSTQCSCLDRMQQALVRKGSCTSICSHECESDDDNCAGKGCPYRSPIKEVPKKPDGNKPDGKRDTDKKVYYVYYFTVEYGNTSSPQTSNKPSTPSSTTPSRPTSPSRPSSASQSASVSSNSKATSKDSCLKYKYCAPKCPTAFSDKPVCSKSACAISEKAASKSTGRRHSVTCSNIKCPTMETENQSPRTPSPADSAVELKFGDIHNPCCVKSCEVAEKVKDLIVEGLAKKTKQVSKFEDTKDPCFCDCECEFNLSGKTTYCPICGGYEVLGDAVKQQPRFMQPHPCPVYHKIYDKTRLIPDRNPWSEDEKQAESSKTGKSTPMSKRQSQIPSSKSVTPIQEKTSDLPTTKAVKKTKKKVGKFTATQSSGGAPASHGDYHKLCHTHIDAVPKHMGWLWTAEDIPGMKPRPKWKPGAANKILVRRYRTIREGVDIILKKKRALLNRKKKIEMKPTLVVTKKDGEYTVQMEVFKKYSKERLRYQYPYDEKPPLIYTIGKTEEVKAKYQRQKERKERRENRRKSRMLQSTFRDKCQEICLKAYNQSIGLLPLPNPNNPECPCDIQHVKPPSPVIDSCSCSDVGTLESSDTDGDDWIIEFTPPMATWEPKAKHLPSVVNNETQYNYLDYKVKCLDKQGNQVPRFFKGPDGRMECSDLGGFYGLDGTWLEINKDGIIAPDNRWVPQNFTGPDGEVYMSEEGFFTDTNGYTWKIGVDGYVDRYGKWQFYPKRTKDKGKSPSTVTGATAKFEQDTPTLHRTKYDTHRNCRKPDYPTKPKEEEVPTSKNIPPDVATNTSKKRGMAGKSAILINKKTTESDKDKSKKVVLKGKVQRVMNVEMKYSNSEYWRPSGRRNQEGVDLYDMNERDKMARYQDIMEGLYGYDDMAEVRPPMKTNRAVDTRTQGTKRITSKNSVHGKYMVSRSRDNKPRLTVKHSTLSSAQQRI